MKELKLSLGTALLVVAAVAGAQQPAIKRVDIQKHDLSAPGREVVQVRVEIDPGAVIGKHTHPGEEVTYVLDGVLQLEIEGMPPKSIGSGEAFTVPAGTVHGARNTGSSTAKALVTYIVEKGKPVATPAK